MGFLLLDLLLLKFPILLPLTILLQLTPSTISHVILTLLDTSLSVARNVPLHHLLELLRFSFTQLLQLLLLLVLLDQVLLSLPLLLFLSKLD